MKFLFIIFVAIIAFAAGIWYMGGFDTLPQLPNTNIPTTTPAAQLIWKNADENKVVVTSPKAGATVASTFTVSGKARGTWYFEASFPLEVLDANGKSLMQAPVQAKSDWMTTEFVLFSQEVTIAGYHGKATLVLKNDNPSGDPEKDASVSVPIVIQ